MIARPSRADGLPSREPGERTLVCNLLVKINTSPEIGAIQERVGLDRWIQSPVSLLPGFGFLRATGYHRTKSQAHVFRSMCREEVPKLCLKAVRGSFLCCLSVDVCGITKTNLEHTIREACA